MTDDGTSHPPHPNKVFEVVVPHFKAKYRRHREGFHDERTRRHQPTAMSNRYLGMKDSIKLKLKLKPYEN